MLRKKKIKSVIDKDGVQRINILAGSFYFDPGYILVRVNVPVEVTIKKEAEITPHDSILDAPEAGLNVKETLSIDPKIVKFTATKTGKYPFYCDPEVSLFQESQGKGDDGHFRGDGMTFGPAERCPLS